MSVKGGWIRVPALSVSVVFVVAAVMKLPEPATMAEVIRSYDVVPQGWVGVLTVILPGVELVAAAGLLLKRWRAGASLLILLILLGFLGASLSALLRGLDPVCGCFGPDSGVVGISSISLEVILIVMTGVVFYRTREAPVGHPLP